MNNPLPFPRRRPCAVHHWRLGDPVVNVETGQTERTDDCRYCDAIRMVVRTEPEPSGSVAEHAQDRP